MGSEDWTIYMIRATEGEDSDEWVSPEPADDVVVDAVVDATDLTTEDLEDLSSYVDTADLASTLEGERTSVTFAVEGHDVTITSDGAVEVD